MKTKKMMKFLCASFIMSTLLLVSTKAYANLENEHIEDVSSKRNPKQMWSGLVRLPYSEPSPPPPYKFFTNKYGYKGWIGYVTLDNDQGYALYAGWLYSGNIYPIPAKVIEWLEMVK